MSGPVVERTIAGLRALQASWTPKMLALNASLPAHDSPFTLAGTPLTLSPILPTPPMVATC